MLWHNVYLKRKIFYLYGKNCRQRISFLITIVRKLCARYFLRIIYANYYRTLMNTDSVCLSSISFRLYWNKFHIWVCNWLIEKYITYFFLYTHLLNFKYFQQMRHEFHSIYPFGQVEFFKTSRSIIEVKQHLPRWYPEGHQFNILIMINLPVCIYEFGRIEIWTIIISNLLI